MYNHKEHEKQVRTLAHFSGKSMGSSFQAILMCVFVVIINLIAGNYGWVVLFSLLGGLNYWFYSRVKKSWKKIEAGEYDIYPSTPKEE
jgi:hypothetical protein